MDGNTKSICSMLERDVRLLEARSKMQETPLMLAACWCQVDTVKELMKRKANVSAVDWSGRNALSQAETSIFGKEEDKKTTIELIKQYTLESKGDISKQKKIADRHKDKGNEMFKKEEYIKAIKH